MRRILLLFLNILFFISVSPAQGDFPFQFGFKLAPNLGWVRPNAEGYSYDGLAGGFNWGIVGEYNIAENYALASGILFTSSGGKLSYPYKSGPESGTLYRRYYLRAIEIPIMMKMRTREIGYLVYYGQVGLGTSFRYNAKSKDEFDITSPDPKTVTTEGDISSDIRLVRESLIIGIGVQYAISGKTALFGGLTFDNGFSNLLKGKNTVDSKINQKAYVNYLELNVGVLF